MKRALVSLLFLSFVSVAVVGCGEWNPFKKKEEAPAEGTQEHGGTEVK